MNALPQLRADLRVRNLLPQSGSLQNEGVRKDVRLLPDCRLRGFKGFVRHQAHPIGIDDQRVARDTGLILLCLGEPAIYDEELAAAVHGRLTLFPLHRHMAVDNV